MIYFILFLIVFIIGTIIFIIVQGKFVLNLEKEPFIPYGVGPLIIEKAYRAHDFRYSLMYQTEENLRYAMLDYTVPVIDVPDHKKYIMRDAVHKMAEEFLDGGFIEIHEQNERGNPYLKRVDLKIKVYKPE
jgi:hypothetical protein